MLPTLNVMSAWNAGSGIPTSRGEQVMTPQISDTVAMLEANNLKIIRR